MAVPFNTLACDLSNPNQGIGSCQYIMAPWVWVLAIPKGSTIVASDAASTKFASLIATKLVADTGRWYRLGPFTNGLIPESNDPATQNFDNGAIFYPRDTVWNLRGIIANSSICQQQNLQKFDGAHTEFDFLFIDNNGILVGQKVTNPSTGALELGGFAIQDLYVMAQTVATFTAVPQSELRMNILNVKAVQANMAIIDLSNTTYVTSLNIGGVQDVYLTTVSVSTTTLKIIASANCSNTNLGLSDIATNYADADNFALFNVTDSTTITPSGVSVNAATGEITFTFTAQTSADTITLKQKAVSTVYTNTGAYLETPIEGQITAVIP
jgi:hypothetical protein